MIRFADGEDRDEPGDVRIQRGVLTWSGDRRRPQCGRSQLGLPAPVGRSEPALESMLALIDVGDGGREVADAVLADPPEEHVVPLSAVRLLAPIPEPRQIRLMLPAVEGDWQLFALN